jgi:hypothetical protein
MKLVTSILLTALLAYTIGLFEFPWWSFAITTFIVFAAIPQQAGKSFSAAFVTLFIMWGIIAFKLDFDNEHLLSKKVANIFPLKGNYVLLIIITSLIGALVAGMAALTGSLARNAFKKKRRTY